MCAMCLLINAVITQNKECAIYDTPCRGKYLNSAHRALFTKVMPSKFIDIVKFVSIIYRRTFQKISIDFFGKYFFAENVEQEKINS